MARRQGVERARINADRWEKFIHYALPILWFVVCPLLVLWRVFTGTVEQVVVAVIAGGLAFGTLIGLLRRRP